MFMRYAGIEIRCMTTQEHARELVTDDTGLDALYVRHAWSVLGVINGQEQSVGNRQYISVRGESVLTGGDANTYVAPADRMQSGLIDGPNYPVLTDRLILESLMTPRRKLKVYSWDENGAELISVESPLPGRGVDARHGPTPLACNIVDHHAGDNTWTVNFQIETYLPVCGTMPALLSNRYRQSHTTNSDYLLTIETAGTAVFRHDALLATNPPISPDQLRQFLAVPIPPGFKRDGIRVATRGDNVTVDWQMTDIQQPYCFVAGREIHATRVVTNFTQAITAPGEKLEGVLGGIERGLQLRLNQKWLRESQTGGDDPNPIRSALRRNGMMK